MAANATENVIEDNTMVGNTNGIFLTTGVKGNVFRRNLVVGNLPVQIALDNPTATGLDIKNMADVGANTFQGNICLTAVNAPCPSSGMPALTASPNPIPLASAARYGTTTINWIAPDADAVEIRIGSPDGLLFAAGGKRGSAPTGLWVPDGMTFYLQDVSGGKPLNADNTLASVVVHLQKK